MRTSRQALGWLAVAAMAIAGCAFAPVPVVVPPPSYWPTAGFRSASPESQGLDSAALAEAVETIRARGLAVHSVSIVVNGLLALDACFYPYDCASLHDVASVTKSVTTTLVGQAIDDGAIASVEQPIRSFFPDFPAEPDSMDAAIRVGDLASMQSGLACGLAPGERELFAMIQQPDWNRYVLALPHRMSPGREFAYCSGGMHLLSSIVSRATHEKTQDFARRRLFTPLGIDAFEWPVDPGGVAHGWGDLHLAPHDLLKLGFLFLNGGRWEREQIVSEGWVREATRPHARAANDDYGYGWWLPRGDFAGVFEARGRGGQHITVWPARNLVAVLTGAGYPEDEVVQLLLRALRSDRALPADPEGEARLARALEAARAAPAARPVATPPEAARTSSGRRYALEPNRFGLESVVASFPGGPQASLELVTRGSAWIVPIGLDGVPRLGDAGPTGNRPAATGRWLDEDRFAVQYTEPSGINSFVLTLTFAPRFQLTIDDPSHMFDLTAAVLDP
ncbi:MAG: serine hydrolase [Deltaproteobacteria bacterium]|nr:serine hydrolase [Deltaproteobacteria bacterium]